VWGVINFPLVSGAKHYGNKCGNNVRGGGKFYSIFLHASAWFISEYNDERMIEIGPYNVKVVLQIKLFMAHTVYKHQFAIMT